MNILFYSPKNISIPQNGLFQLQLSIGTVHRGVQYALNHW